MVVGKHDIVVKLDESKLEDFKKAIKMPISTYFRNHQEDVVEEYRKNKDNKDGTLDLVFHTKDKEQTTLDVFKLNVPQILKEIEKIDSLQELGTLEHKLHSAYNIARNKKLAKLGQLKQTYK